MAIFGWSWPRFGRGASDQDHFIREPVWLGGGAAAAEIDNGRALQVAAFLCGARVIAEGVSQVPFKLFRETDTAGIVVREPARQHPAYRLLADQPNGWQSSFEFRETLTLHAVVTGNGYAAVSRRGRDGVPLEMVPLSPDDVSCVWDSDRREVVYEVRGLGPQPQMIRVADMLHVRGPSWDGRAGMHVARAAAAALGLALSMEKSHADLYGKGGRPSGVLSHDGPLAPEAIERMKQRWQERFGPGGDGGVAVLDGAWKFTPMTMNATDAQFIETWRFQIEEVARYLRVFPQMLMQADKTATYASAEQFFIAHITHTLMPWFLRWEQAVKRVLIGYDGANADIYPRHSVEGLLRGASADRAEFYKAALGAGGSPAWMTPNEIRVLENLNPIEGGDVLPQPPGSQEAAPDAD